VLNGTRFSVLGTDTPGACVDPARQHLLVAWRIHPGNGSARTVVYGIADRTVTSLVLAIDGRRDAVPIASDGTYLKVIIGRYPWRRALVHARTTTGPLDRALPSGTR
jgi:hypothetical protein